MTVGIPKQRVESHSSITKPEAADADDVSCTDDDRLPFQRFAASDGKSKTVSEIIFACIRCINSYPYIV